MTKHVDIIIVGGGLTGLMLANLLKNQSLKIAIIEAHQPNFHWGDQLPLRVSAINQTSQLLFLQLGLWDKISEQAQTYNKMSVWDESSDGQIHFDARDYHQSTLGHIIPNRVMQKSLWQALERSRNKANIQFYCPNTIKQFVNLNTQQHVILDDGTHLSCDLLIAADGKYSEVRKHYGIQSKKGSYNQQAFVAVVSHEKPHSNTAYQRFLSTGPLALLPLNPVFTKEQSDCGNLSSIVWSCTNNFAEHIAKLDHVEFDQALTNAVEGRLGNITCLSEHTSFPLTYHHAKTYTLSGVALIGDAAHSIHPLAGQGVNLGFADAKALANILITAQQKNQALGNIQMLKHYERERRLHNSIALKAMNGLNQLFLPTDQTISSLRGIGLNTSDKLEWLKKLFIQTAAGKL